MESSNGLTATQIEGLKHTETVEQEIVRKGLSAPRVTPADIEASIRSVVFLNAHDGAVAYTREPQAEELKLLTLAVVVTQNGFTVVGKSACASAANFDKALGERIALEDAKRQLWPLLGYALRDRLAAQTA